MEREGVEVGEGSSVVGGWKRGERRGINTKKHLLKLEMVRGKGDVTL